MNLHALWCFGSGLTTGILWRWFYSKDAGWLINSVVFFLMMAIWPILALRILYDVYAREPLPWDPDS